MASLRKLRDRYTCLIKTFASRPSSALQMESEQAQVWSELGLESDVGNLRRVYGTGRATSRKIVDPAKKSGPQDRADGDPDKGWTGAATWWSNPSKAQQAQQ